MALGPSESFVDSLNKAREIPTSQSGSGYDMPSVFGPMPGSGAGAQNEGAVGTKLPCVAHSKVFTIWRDWEGCKRCLSDIDHQVVTLPASGDYTCPHTSEAEFKMTLDRCLAGDGALQSKEFFNLQNGTRCAHVVWMEADEKRLGEMKKAEEEKDKNWVYPPRLDQVFGEQNAAAKKAADGLK
jgi:hypothetical protein